MNSKYRLSRLQIILIAAVAILVIMLSIVLQRPRELNAGWAKEIALNESDFDFASLSVLEDADTPNWNTNPQAIPGDCEEWAHLARLFKDQISWSKVAFKDKKPGTGGRSGRYKVSQQILKMNSLPEAEKAADLLALGAKNPKCETVQKYSFMTETYLYSNGAVLKDAFATRLNGSRMVEFRTVDLGFSVSTTESEYIIAQRESVITIIELRIIQNPDSSDVVTLQDVEPVAELLLDRFGG